MFDAARGLRADPAAGRVRAGETDPAHQRVIDQGAADFLSEPRDHIDHSGR
ncbi:Uncharacterised protein [Mycobacteroides abscessus subsp. abscessus]|nr:Uncharacterised protein [Mycobacteroides abscessus subsp. abscessus]